MMSQVAVNMKFGVVVVHEFEEYNEQNVMPLVDSLQMLGCEAENIVVKVVPTAHDVVIATQFMAEYTDVDGVIILAPQNRIMGTLSVMNGIVQLQIQWNMVVEIGGVECAEHIVNMIVLQNEMEMEAPENRNPRLNLS
jgi:6,7-dimethyl-8-ribityllumazine synthase